MYLCAYVIVLHVLKIDRVHGYWFCTNQNGSVYTCRRDGLIHEC